MASVFFLLWRHRVWLRWAHLTDLRVDLDKFLVQDLQFTEFGDLSFGLERRSLVGQGFRGGLAIDLVGQAQVGAVPRVFGLMAVAVGLATAACGGSDRATTQIAQGGDLIGDVGPLLL